MSPRHDFSRGPGIVAYNYNAFLDTGFRRYDGLNDADGSSQFDRHLFNKNRAMPRMIKKPCLIGSAF